MAGPDTPASSVDVGCYRIPTDAPEAGGTVEWAATTRATVHVRAGEQVGFACTYAHRAAGAVIAHTFADVVIGNDALAPQTAWQSMRRGARDLGSPA